MLHARHLEEMLDTGPGFLARKPGRMEAQFTRRATASGTRVAAFVQELR